MRRLSTIRGGGRIPGRYQSANRCDSGRSPASYRTVQSGRCAQQLRGRETSLGRAIGLPLGQIFEIADQLPYADINPPTVEDALKMAYNSRSDFRSVLDSSKSAEQALSAAKDQRYPVVAVNGDYGDQGPTFGQSHGLFSFQAGVNVPIFTGGRIKGDITQAEATLRQRKAEAENIRGQIDYDVRTAFSI
jgi:outer membrane protein TolC